MAKIQFIESLVGILLGGTLAVCYDLYRVLFPCGKVGSLLRILGDLFWWIFAFCLTFTTLVLLNWGELRLFFLLFLALGFWVWHRAFSCGFRQVLQWVKHILQRLLCFLYRFLERSLIVLFSPFFLLLQLAWKILSLLRIPFGYLTAKSRKAGIFCRGKIRKSKMMQLFARIGSKKPPEA